jgi:hypothetical protein
MQPLSKSGDEPLPQKLALRLSVAAGRLLGRAVP